MRISLGVGSRRERLNSTFARFPLTMAFAILATVTGLALLHTGRKGLGALEADMLLRLLLVFCSAKLLSISYTLYVEGHEHHKRSASLTFLLLLGGFSASLFTAEGALSISMFLIPGLLLLITVAPFVFRLTSADSQSRNLCFLVPI